MRREDDVIAKNGDAIILVSSATRQSTRVKDHTLKLKREPIAHGRKFLIEKFSTIKVTAMRPEDLHHCKPARGKK
jgi:sulfate adenylyltransferase subunit 1 (EFTu-like GTPase family)